MQDYTMSSDLPIRTSRTRRWAVPGNLVVLAIALLVGAEAIFQPRFLTLQNLGNVSRTASLLSLVAVGQMFAILVRGFDLSIGATMAFTSIVVATVLAHTSGELNPALLVCISIAASVATGAFIGAVNGLVVTALRVHSFIVTLGSASIITGFALWLTDGIPIYGLPRSFIDGFGRATWLGVSSFVWVAAITLAALAALYNLSFVGKYIRAAGRDQRASELSGINTRAYIILAYALCSACAALGSLLLTSQMGSGQASIGTVFTFQSIAVCIIGGVSLLGGRASIANVVLAAVFMQLLNNCFELFRIPSQAQSIVAGLIVMAIAIGSLGRSE